MYSGNKSRGWVGFVVCFLGSGIKISGTYPSRFGVGSGFGFWGQVGFRDQDVGVVPLGFLGFGSPNTSLVSSHNKVFLLLWKLFWVSRKLKRLAKLVFKYMKNNLASPFSFQNKIKFVLTFKSHGPSSSLRILIRHFNWLEGFSVFKFQSSYYKASLWLDQ